MFRRCAIVLGVLCVACSSVPHVLATVTYNITDLGTLPGYSGSRASGINACGQVVGYASSSSDNHEHAFLYTNGTMTDLGAIPGDTYSFATGISDNGTVVGYSGSDYYGNGPTHAFIYSNGSMTSLGTFAGSKSQATGINASGQVVGFTFASKYGDEYGFLYTNGTLTNLGVGAPFSINAGGQVVGSANTFHAAGPAFLYSSGTRTNVVLPHGRCSEAYSINASAQVVGWSDTGGNERYAFLYSNGTITNLGTLGGQYSSAYGINAHGQVVGWSRTSSDHDHAFLYDGGRMTDLNSLIDSASGWTLYEGDAINDSGQIVGAGYHDGGTRAFLLTPTPIPEPSTLALLGSGVVGLLGYFWRRRASRRAVTALFAAAAVFSWVGSASAAVMYNAVDLGMFSAGYRSCARGINNSGQVVGNIGYDAFVYSGGTMTNLGPVCRAQMPFYPNSVATAINDAGQIVGYAQNSDGACCAFLYRSGTVTSLRAPDNVLTWANGINASGQVAIGASTAVPGWSDGYGHSFIYNSSNATWTNLGTLPGGMNSEALAINNVGQVVGDADIDGNRTFVPMIYCNGTMVRVDSLPGRSVSTASIADCYACDINDNSQIVGVSALGGFLYSNGTTTYLGTLAGRNEYPWAINSSGTVVGIAGAPFGPGRAFVYSHGTATDLNSLIDPRLGFMIGGALDINDSGWIVGYGTNASGQDHAFLLTPIPEPATLILVGIGSISLLAYAWRRRASRQVVTALAVVAVILSAACAQADVFNLGGTRNPTTGTWTGLASLEFVPVGDPGNAADTATGYGSVGYSYWMGKYDVTCGQYVAFLNAVAKTDTYGLYNTNMWSSFYGCKIQRDGASGNYTYAVPSDWADRPVVWVCWGDAARFANWLTNGQPTGDQGLHTTEDGSYYLNGATTNAQLLAVTRRTDARYVIPTVDEWYKAAYYRGDGVVSGYWSYPTKSDTGLSNILSSTGTNNANFRDDYGTGNGTYTIGGPYWRTEVGGFAGSPGPYGTFDQGGDVYQWNETIPRPSARGTVGGSWEASSTCLTASFQVDRATPPSYEDPIGGKNLGFRVASVPEPSSLALLLAGGIGVLGDAWRRRMLLRLPLGVAAMFRRCAMVLGVLGLLFADAGSASAVVMYTITDLAAR
jgi:formylglycine-generating enzyme